MNKFTLFTKLFICCIPCLTYAKYETELLASDSNLSDLFGSSVAIWGEYAVVGGASYDDNVNGTDAGAAYIYKRQGNLWSEQ